MKYIEKRIKIDRKMGLVALPGLPMDVVVTAVPRPAEAIDGKSMIVVGFDLTAGPVQIHVAIVIYVI